MMTFSYTALHGMQTKMHSPTIVRNTAVHYVFFLPRREVNKIMRRTLQSVHRLHTVNNNYFTQLNIIRVQDNVDKMLEV